MSDPFMTSGAPRPVAPHRGALILVLGILGIVACMPLGIVAWVMGNNDLAAMRSGRMDRSGESLTQVGKVLGILSAVLFALVIVFVALVLPLFLFFFERASVSR